MGDSLREDSGGGASEPPGTSRRPLLAREALADFGRYALIERVGAGGMGDVYAAFDRTLDRKVALKVLRTSRENFEARLVREARAMAQLSHPNVVSVFDTGVVDGRLFVAMEFVHGATLKSWQQAPERTWREVLRAYSDAGRGLAAAHAAGLVHRDFKPDNVLVSEAGAVKVTDFGIVRALTAEGDDDAAAGQTREISSPRAIAAAEGPMTVDGALLGTPGYMAPEQVFCEPIDARTDQFAFCVALYEGLYGKRPFEGSDLAKMTEAALCGRVGEPPRGTKVPSWVRRALLRGLEGERDARYPSMHALLDALARDPAQRTRRAALIAGAVGLALGAGVWVQHALGARHGALCTGAPEEANEVWNADAKARVERALLATGVPYAADTWQRTRDRIDGYMRDWTTMHTQTCEATRVLGEQPEATLMLRMACLQRRREDVRALVRVLSGADRDVASKALQASYDLASLDGCANVSSLGAVVAEPQDPAKRVEIAAIRGELATARAEFEGGKYVAARDLADAQVERALRLGYDPLSAEALLLSAQANAEIGNVDKSVQDASQAVFRADLGRADAARAEAATCLLGWSRETGRLDQLDRWSAVAEASLLRANDRGAGRAKWLLELGRMTGGKLRGNYAEAAERYRAAVLAGRSAGVSEERTAEIEREWAMTEAGLGHTEEAERLISEADDMIRRAMGDDHPRRIRFLMARGFNAELRGDNRSAYEYDMQAIELGERVAPDHSSLAPAYGNACTNLYYLGDARGALPLCEKSIEICLRHYGGDNLRMVHALLSSGHALVALGRYDEGVARYKSVLAFEQKTGATRQIYFIEARAGLGRALLLSGKPKEAVAVLEQALALRRESQAASIHIERVDGEARFSLAQALWQGGTRTARVAGLAQEAVAIDRRVHLDDEAARIERWLETHAAL